MIKKWGKKLGEKTLKTVKVTRVATLSSSTFGIYDQGIVIAPFPSIPMKFKIFETSKLQRQKTSNNNSLKKRLW